MTATELPVYGPEDNLPVRNVYTLGRRFGLPEEVIAACADLTMKHPERSFWWNAEEGYSATGATRYHPRLADKDPVSLDGALRFLESQPHRWLPPTQW